MTKSSKTKAGGEIWDVCILEMAETKSGCKLTPGQQLTRFLASVRGAFSLGLRLFLSESLLAAERGTPLKPPSAGFQAGSTASQALWTESPPHPTPPRVSQARPSRGRGRGRRWLLIPSLCQHPRRGTAPPAPHRSAPPNPDPAARAARAPRTLGQPSRGPSRQDPASPAPPAPGWGGAHRPARQPLPPPPSSRARRRSAPRLAVPAPLRPHPARLRPGGGTRGTRCSHLLPSPHPRRSISRPCGLRLRRGPCP